jgi:hypothetical protein
MEIANNILAENNYLSPAAARQASGLLNRATQVGGAVVTELRDIASATGDITMQYFRKGAATAMSNEYVSNAVIGVRNAIGNTTISARIGAVMSNAHNTLLNSRFAGLAQLPAIILSPKFILICLIACATLLARSSKGRRVSIALLKGIANLIKFPLRVVATVLLFAISTAKLVLGSMFSLSLTALILSVIVAAMIRTGEIADVFGALPLCEICAFTSCICSVASGISLAILSLIGRCCTKLTRTRNARAQ